MTKAILSTGVVLLVTFVSCVFCVEDYFVCKSVSSVFLTNSTRPVRGPRGPVGKSGPMGPQGSPGPKGEKGTSFNIDVINSKIDTAIIKHRICHGIQLENQCIQLAYNCGPKTNRHEAAAICESRGGELAHIASKVIYDLVSAYVKRFWIGFNNGVQTSYVQIWLGSIYNATTNSVQAGGVSLSFVQWYHSYPRGDQYMGIEIPTVSSRTTNGMFDIHAGHKYPVPLCSFPSLLV